MNKLVSIAIPTFNCEKNIKECLKSLKKQTYKPLEIIVVDSFSADKTPEIAKKYNSKVYSFGRDPKNIHAFGAPYQRNFGAAKATGEYLYWLDSDMRLPPDLIETCVKELEGQKADAVIIPELSVGESFWAECRRLEKECYNKASHSYTDTARFLKKKVWDKIGGIDPALGGNDDFDLQIKLDKNGYKTIKIKKHVLHYEGKLSLKKQMTKKFVYGKTVLNYLKKHKNEKGRLQTQYALIRPEFLQNFDLLAKDPLHAAGMIFMKIMEYSAGLAGLLYSLIKKEKVEVYETKQALKRPKKIFQFFNA